MDQLLIKGPTKLEGEVRVSRAKNAYLPILAAVLLTDKPVHLKNLPALRDIRTMMKLLENLGVKIHRNGDVTTFDASNLSSHEATYELVKTMRASIFVLGPLLARLKKAKVSLPGGCAIGTRPIDIHLTNLEKLGAKITLESGYVDAQVDKFVPKRIALSFPSVGATENLMMASVFSDGETIIDNCALEPEVDDLANFLIAMGAKIEGVGTSSLRVTGVKEFKEAHYEAIGDRIEAATFIIGAAMTKSKISIRGFDPLHLRFVLTKLEEMGAQIERLDDGVIVSANGLIASDVDTAPFPGFPTDVQAQMMALMTQAEGSSVMNETIFENRFMHVPELKRLGADIKLKGHTAIVKGKTVLKGAPVMCTDLRASAALVLAALVAEGETVVDRIYHLDRGYEALETKLTALGANIRRVNVGS
jgi:UDP-N-acetylglucosamine 1-carboxyvinyltransferase